MESEEHIRPPGVAGKFYSDDPEILSREIALFLENSIKKDIPSPIKGLLCPHAGFMFSGGVAAKAYRQIHGEDFDLAVVISPSHYESFMGVSIFPGNAYEIPLGKIECDMDLGEKLASEDPNFKLSLEGHSLEEHALEVQLPFLHKVLSPGFKILPLVMGEQNYQIARRLGHALHNVLSDRKAIVIASSDLSHFFADDVAREKDAHVEEAVKNFDIMGLAEKVETKAAQMCGYGPTLAMMIYSRLSGATKSDVLLYRNSSDITGDTSSVVGYLAAMVY